MNLPVRRPSFPARMPGGSSALPVASLPTPSSASGATKLIAASAYSTVATALNSSKKPAAVPVNRLNAAASAAPSGLGMESGAVRRRMVDNLAKQGISDAAVLAAMNTIERHRFVDTALVGQAYEDTSLPIGLGQTISKPNVVARMLSLLREGRATNEKGKMGRVLEIGTGCGYQAAVLAQLCTEVYSMERLRGLHDKARENLRPFKIAHLHLLLADGMLGYAKGGPYAGIIAAAGGEAIPQAWVDQLAVGGRVVAPTVMANGSQALVVLDKTPQGVTHTVLEPVHFVPLKSGVL